MNFPKPFPTDYRKPDDAEELLEKELGEVIDTLKAEGIKEEEIVIGFIDETSPQLTSNTVRIWSFGRPEIVKNTTKIKVNTIRFYAINGRSVGDFLENSKSENIANFMEKVREESSKCKAIIGIMDNLPHIKLAK